MLLLVKHRLIYVFFLFNTLWDPLKLFHDPLMGNHLQSGKHWTRRYWKWVLALLFYIVQCYLTSYMSGVILLSACVYILYPHLTSRREAGVTSIQGQGGSQLQSSDSTPGYLSARCSAFSSMLQLPPFQVSLRPFPASPHSARVCLFEGFWFCF